jgi:Ala-tRNA(Pro) deacylase
MVAPIIRDFLEDRHARFTETVHPRVNTALAEAQKDHTLADEMAKTVVVHAGGGFVLLALSANSRIDWTLLAKVLGSGHLRLASETELELLFPDLEVGAVPPLGPLFRLPVYVDAHLAAQERISFNAGSHTNTIHMPFSQFQRLVEPCLCRFADRENR